MKMLCCSLLARDPTHVGIFGSDRVLRATKRRAHLSSRRGDWADMVCSKEARFRACQPLYRRVYWPQIGG